MKKINLKPRIIITTAFILASVALVTAAINRRKAVHVKPPVKQAVPAHAEQAIVYDSVMLQKFIKTIHSLDFNKRQCTYSGVIEMEDGNDTTNNVHNLGFLFCKSGSDYYYKVGNAEIIHREGLNLYIQHDQQKIVLSAQTIHIKPPVSNIPLIEKTLQSEHYTLQHTEEGKYLKLSLLNEQHISCKELSVTLDTVSGKLERIYTRLTDFGNPADKHKDRFIDVRLSQVNDRGDMSLYPSWQRFVRKSGGKWQVTGDYHNYELILL